MTDTFEPPDDATPAPTPKTERFGLTPEQWELQGPPPQQYALPPSAYVGAPAPLLPTPGYNSLVHPAPPPIPAWTPPPSNSLATSGMVLGIIAACFFWFPGVNFILAVLAIALGGVGWNTANKTNIGKGRAITAVVLGVVTLVGWFVFWGAILAAGTAGTTGT